MGTWLLGTPCNTALLWGCQWTSSFLAIPSFLLPQPLSNGYSSTSYLARLASTPLSSCPAHTFASPCSTDTGKPQWAAGGSETKPLSLGPWHPLFCPELAPSPTLHIAHILSCPAVLTHLGSCHQNQRLSWKALPQPHPPSRCSASPPHYPFSCGSCFSLQSCFCLHVHQLSGHTDFSLPPGHCGFLSLAFGLLHIIVLDALPLPPPGTACSSGNSSWKPSSYRPLLTQQC